MSEVVHVDEFGEVMKRDFLIYADIDGVLTPCTKLFRCTPERPKPAIEDRWSKTYSDRDSYVLRMMKDDLVFISNDKRNKYYTDYKGHKFCFVDHADGDKYDGLKKDWAERVRNQEVCGDPEKPRYLYIGDAPFDWLCLKHAIHGFVPADASIILLDKCCGLRKITRLSKRGGEGCIESMMYNLSIRQEEFPMVSDLPAIKEIRKFIEDGDV